MNFPKKLFHISLKSETAIFEQIATRIGNKSKINTWERVATTNVAVATTQGLANISLGQLPVLISPRIPLKVVSYSK
jgi:hypothetical protein